MLTKRINPKAILYHYFEFTNSKGFTTYALFDADMDIPVSYGSRNLVGGTIKNLPRNVRVIYYKPDVDKITFQNPNNQQYDGTKKKRGT